jgi:hypothetical protein
MSMDKTNPCGLKKWQKLQATPGEKVRPKVKKSKNDLPMASSEHE